MATGYGEDIARFNLTSRVVEYMRGGVSARQACREAIRFMARRMPNTQGRMVAVLAVRKDGDYGVSSTQEGFVAYVRTVRGTKRA